LPFLHAICVEQLPSPPSLPAPTSGSTGKGGCAGGFGLVALDAGVVGAGEGAGLCFSPRHFSIPAVQAALPGFSFMALLQSSLRLLSVEPSG
jgi:hypothetical protein